MRVQMLSGMERISSAPRLNFSSQDIFNLRNSTLQLSRSTPGICNTNRNSQEQRLNLLPETSPKSILVKSKEESMQEIVSEVEVEDRKPDYSIRLELQFSAFVLLCFVLGIFIPLSMIIVGLIYIHNCPAQVMIPVFLVVEGSVFLSGVMLFRKLSRKSEECKNHVCYKLFVSVFVCGHVAWFIAGCSWIYGIYEPDFINESSPLFCEKTLYLYSFWLLNSLFLTLAMFAAIFTIYIVFGREQTLDIEGKV